MLLSPLECWRFSMKKGSVFRKPPFATGCSKSVGPAGCRLWAETPPSCWMAPITRGRPRHLPIPSGKTPDTGASFWSWGSWGTRRFVKVLRPTVSLADYVFYTQPAYWRAAAPEVLMQKAAFLGKPGETVPELSTAISKAKEMAGPEDLILITGSLFTVGEALAHFEGRKPDF